MTEHTDDKLVESAVKFLNDTSVKDATLVKKIEFLQSKGLSPEQIGIALQRRGQNDYSVTGTTTTQSDNNVQNNREVNRNIDSLYEVIPPPIPERNWKDYFIMATVSCGLMYGCFELTKRYVLPNIMPESKGKLEKDKDEINKQFQQVDNTLQKLEEEYKEFKLDEQKKLNELDTTIKLLNDSILDVNKVREMILDDFKLIKLELNHLKDSIDNIIQDKEDGTELNKIKQELLSLGNLIRNSSFNNSNNPVVNHTITHDPQHNAAPTHAKSRSEIDALIEQGRKTEPAYLIPTVDNIPKASDLLASLHLNGQSPDGPLPNLEGARNDLDGNPETLEGGSSLENSASGSEIPAWQKMLNSPEI